VELEAGDLRIEVSLESGHEQFKAGRLKYFVSEWKKLTQDNFIFELVKGFKIEFVSQPSLVNRSLLELRLKFLNKKKDCWTRRLIN
jgi:hypothetical protein